MDKHTQKRDELFVSASPTRVFRAFSLPVILGMIVSLVYNMVDAYFVGQLGDASQMAAVSLCSPLFLLLMGLGNIFGIGGSSVVSRMLGRQEHETVKRASSLCFWVSCLIGMIVVVLMFILHSPIIRLLGADDSTFSYTRSYMLWYIAGAPAILIQFTLMNLLRCDGAAKESMIGSIVGSVVNMLLDPVFIFWLGLGVAGAAIATVIGNICTVAFFLWALKKRAPSLSIAVRDFKPDLRLMGSVFSIGLPASITNALTSVATVLMNNLLGTYGVGAIAGMGIAMRLNQIVILLQIGFAAGLPPVIGYNWGAGNMKRLREILTAAVRFTLFLGTSLTVITYWLAPDAVRLFMQDEAVVTPGTQLLRGLMLCGPFLGLLFIITNFFQATGKALPALLLSLCRQGIVFAAVLFPMNAILGWTGLVYAQPTADYITLAIAIALFCLTSLKPLLSEDRKV